MASARCQGQVTVGHTYLVYAENAGGADAEAELWLLAECELPAQAHVAVTTMKVDPSRPTFDVLLVFSDEGEAHTQTIRVKAPAAEAASYVAAHLYKQRHPYNLLLSCQALAA